MPSCCSFDYWKHAGIDVLKTIENFEGLDMRWGHWLLRWRKWGPWVHPMGLLLEHTDVRYDKVKEPSRFYPFFPIFPLFFRIFPDFFPIFGIFFAVRGGTLPLLAHHSGYATGLHPFSDTSNLQLVHATLSVITAMDWAVQGGHNFMNVGVVLINENNSILTCAFELRTSLIMTQDSVFIHFRSLCNLQLVHAIFSVITALK